MGKFYLKHIFRTVGKAPAQPFLIILIFLLSFSLLNVGISSGMMMKAEERERIAQENGNADVTVSTGAGSSSRFLFAEDAEAVLDGITVTSSFTMPYLKDGALVSGVAVPFSTVGDVFDIRFETSRGISRGEIAKVAFITRSFADGQNLALGDSFSLEVFGKTVTYEVAGISPYPFLGSADVMVDVTGAVGILIDDPTVSTILGSTFAPGGTLHIRLSEDTDRESAVAALRAAFPNDNITAVDNTETSGIVVALQAIVILIVLMTAVASFSVASCCVSCMAKDRAESAMLFSTCGVTERKMLLFQIAEIALYTAVSAGIGIAISGIVGRATVKAIGFTYVTYAPNALSLLLSAAIVLSVAAVTPVIFRIRQKKREGRFRLPAAARVILPAFLALTFAEMLLIGGGKKFTVMIIVMLTMFLLIASYAPRIFCFIAAKLSKKAKSVPGAVALKNACRVPALSNTVRLLSLLTVVLFSTFTATCISGNFVNREAPKVLDADYTLTGGTARVTETLAGVPEIGAIYGSAFVEGHLQSKSRNTVVSGWAFSSSDTVNDMKGVALPQGDEIVTSYAYACKFSLRKGDRVTVTFGSVTKEVTVREVLNSNIFFMVFDPDVFDISYDSYLIKAADGVSQSDLYAAVTETLAAETVSVLPATAAIDRFIGYNMIYIYFSRIVAVLLLLFSLIGVSDNLVESYRSRREEFGLYTVAGMSKKKLRTMLATELVFTFCFIAVIGIPLCALTLATMREGLLTFGVELYLLL
ncbi:MAG: hypothetical protein MJ082_00710 [Clostridia bacterium]|nr:hypothetical protein [Clostridia bacterium]